MTTLYLVRHSKCLKVEHKNTKDNLQIQNEKQILSIEGEQIASQRFDLNIFDDIDSVYSSNYVRAISTAKYVANKNDLEIHIMDGLGERNFGISSWDELPANFERQQFLDEDYKIGNGENRKEVRERMYASILKILNKNKNKKVVIVSHATAISYLLQKWCDIEIKEDKLRYSFNGNILLDGYFNYCETFKLEFDDDNQLISVQHISFD